MKSLAQFFLAVVLAFIAVAVAIESYPWGG